MRSIYLVAILLCSYAISATLGKPACDTVQCIVAPCRFSPCPAYPNATCVDNYCGGCNADFYVNGVKVNCTKPDDVKVNWTKPATSKCNGTIVECFVAPCRFKKCPAYPEAVCIDNYCDGCFADFYNHGLKVDCGSDPIA